MSSRSPRTPFVLAGFVAALGLGLGVGAATYAVLGDDSSTVVRQVTVTGSEPAAAADGLSTGAIYDRSFKSVVEITATAGDPSGFAGGRQRAQGSGFVYDRQGHIVTNQHVIQGAGSITVRFWDGSTFEARLVGADPSTDLAVIRIDTSASALVPLQLADSSKARVGDAVVAVGSPFGLEGTATTGIVSALQRQMTAPNDFAITNSIQTDAAINHGNSGGPLLDGHGRVLGVNTQIESDSGGSDGVGFAIPSNTVRTIAAQLIDSGEVNHAYLGITMVAVSNGVAVTQVRNGTPAEDAGLKAANGTETIDGQEVPAGGDVIVAFDGVAITSSAQLQRAVDAKRPGDTASLTIVRAGKRRTIEVTLAERPS